MSVRPVLDVLCEHLLVAGDGRMSQVGDQFSALLAEAIDFLVGQCLLDVQVETVGRAVSAKLRRLPLALRQQDASELRRLQDDVVIVDDRIQDAHQQPGVVLRRPFAMALLSNATLHLLKRSLKFLQPRIVTWGLGRRVLGILTPRRQMCSNP
ncbi:hypothetical protein HPB52_001222 [Rhipicephalus sanguineus]|uniref:Uncharacterized protein n=1 Tax=Rhipicephalus sanguineus TaxID=34632 RepID=A0A9D4PY47_RHISA|nr:hypothetical protein HPB52_001222 [Rhipicephalus sanguineus]